MVCLDTDILIGLLHNNPESKRKLTEIVESGKTIKTTVFTAGELYAGAYFLESYEAVTRIENLLSNIEILYPNTDFPRLYGKHSASLQKSGKSVPAFDLAIAIVTLIHDEALLTRDFKHFSKVEGLKIAMW